MTTIAVGELPVRPATGRNVFLAFTAAVWVAVLSGFGTDSFRHVLRYGLDYPLIVHFHAVVFVGYLVVFTVQVALIRNGRADIHRRLGAAAAILAGGMLVLGPLTAIQVDAHRYATDGTTPEFLSARLTDILAFGTLAGAALGEGFWGDTGGLYFGSDCLMLGLGASDLATRRSLHPAYIVGVIWTITLQLIARAGLHSPTWKVFALHLIGH
jgi:hypothetical protein